MWYNKILINDINYKEIMWKKYKKTGLEIHYNKFKEVRARIKREIDIAKYNYNKNLANKIINQPELFWNDVKIYKAGRKMKIEFLLIDNVKINNSIDMANEFARHFNSVYIMG